MTKLNKIILGVLVVLITVFLFILELDYVKDIEHQKQFHYLNTDIIIKIKTKSFKKDIVFNNIETILKEYDMFIQKQSRGDLINLYKINHNFDKSETLTLDAKLYNLIKCGVSLYSKTDGMIDISKGNIIDLWDSYLTTNLGIPNTYELALANNQRIEDIILLEGNQIKNNKVNINLDYIIKGYVMGELKDYLNRENIISYYINMDDLIAVGSDKTYKIGLKNPDNESSVLKILEESDKVISHTSYSNNCYDYNGVKYNNIINPKTLNPVNYHKSIWVIYKDANKANYLSKVLFMMQYDEGINYIKNIDDIKVIWLTLDDKLLVN